MTTPGDPGSKIRFRPGNRAVTRVHASGQRVALFEDLYHKVLGMPWWRFFAYVAATWLGINAAFALVYVASPGCIANARPGDFEDAFYFSVQTLATIGYGAMSPATRYGHLVVVVQALVGTLGVALVTGATFAKFARPTARVLFSDKAVVQNRDGIPHLVFRLANWRGNMVIEGRLRVVLLLLHRTREGDTIRHPLEIRLVRSETPMFALTWMAMHRIDRRSPFWGGEAALDGLKAQGADLYLAFSGLDDTLSQRIHARYMYRLSDIVYNARFADVLRLEEDGSRSIDYALFHDVAATNPGDALDWTAAEALEGGGERSP